MQIEDLLDRVKKHFGYLFEEYGFEVMKLECARSFGNCLAVLESVTCRIVISRDRSQAIVDVGPSSLPEKSFALPFVVGFLDQATGHSYNPLDLDTEIYSNPEEKQWELVGDLLKQYCPSILELFRPTVFLKEQERLEAYVREKVTEHMERFQGEKGKVPSES